MMNLALLLLKNRARLRREGRKRSVDELKQVAAESLRALAS